MDGNGISPDREVPEVTEQIPFDSEREAVESREQQKADENRPEEEREGARNGEIKSQLEQCRERILSNEYADSIIRMAPMLQSEENIFSGFCMQQVDDNFSIIHIGRSNIPPLLYENYNYDAFPNLFGLMDKESLDASGILSMQNQPNLNLRGQGVIIGFIDTGIDYANVTGAGKRVVSVLAFSDRIC